MAFYNRLPLFGPHLKSDSRLAIHSPEEQKKLQAEYRDALGIGKNTTFSAEAFDALAKGSIRDVHLFKATKGPGDVALHDKLTGSSLTTPEDKAAAKEVRDAIDKALKASTEFEKAQKKYTESVATFRQLADKVPGTHKVSQLIDMMAELKSDAIKAIEVQQQTEKKLLEEQFKNPDFRKNLSQALSLNGDADIDVVKTNMMADLEANQKKQLDSFKKSTTASETTLHIAAKAEQSELLFIANLHKNNAPMRQKIIEIAEQKRQQAIREAQEKGLPPPPQGPAVGVTLGANKNGMVISGVTVADLKMIKSITGKTIRQDPDHPGTFEVDFKLSLLEPLYGLDPRQNAKADFMLMAQGVRASGFEKIKMEMDFQPQEVAMERARQAYEAAVESGFPPQAIPKDEKNPDKIVMIVNNTEMRVDELFKGQGERLRAIHGKAASIAEQLKELSTLPKGPVDLTAIRKDMNELRAQNKAAIGEEVTEDHDLGEPAEPTTLTVQ